MTTEPTVLGIDLGTSSVKVVLGDGRGRLLDQAIEAYPVARPHAGWAETDPLAWWAAIIRAVGRLNRGAGPGTPVGVGLSGQMHGVVLCDADAVPVRPCILWCDTRAEAQLASYRALPDDLRARLRNPITVGMAGPQLAWLQQHEDQLMQTARWALQPKDWVRARLTGRIAAEPSDASATLLYNADAQAWDDLVVDALGVRRDLLPPILSHSGTVAGAVTANAAGVLGIPTGIPVAAGAADTAAAALGTGLLDQGRTLLTIGTGVQLIRIVAAPDAASVSEPLTHLYRDSTPSGWYAMAASLTGGQSLEWVRSVLATSWDELNASGGREPLPSDPLFVPHLAGERTPYLNSRLRGSWTGLDAGHDRETLLYSALEGVAFAAADALHALPVDPAGPRQLLLAGGGTTSPAWRSLLADVLNRPLEAVEAPSASARGASLLAAQAAGLIDPSELGATAEVTSDPVATPGHRVGVLQQRFDRYREVLEALAPS